MVFGLENGKTCPVDFTLDFTGSTNLNCSYPETQEPAGKVKVRVEAGSKVVVARVVPAAPGQCQIRSKSHVDEVSSLTHSLTHLDSHSHIHLLLPPPSSPLSPLSPPLPVCP